MGTIYHSALVLIGLAGSAALAASVGPSGAEVHHWPDHPAADAAGLVLSLSTSSDIGAGEDDPRSNTFPPVFDGWPQHRLQERSRDGGVLVQADDDPELEILVLAARSTRRVHLLNLDGTELPGWPLTVPIGVRPLFGVAFGDLDGDGQGEIVVASDNGPSSPSGWVFAWHLDGSVVSGFPGTIDGQAFGSPTVSDLDGDGRAEIIIPEMRGEAGRLFVFDGDGQIRAGWPQHLSERPSGGSAATFDIDGDGTKEIIFEAYASMWAFHSDGTVLDGYPIAATDGRLFSYSSPIIADMDGDGVPEMAFGNHASSPTRGHLFLTTLQGDILPGWPTQTRWWVYAAPTFADLDGDGDLEVICGDLVVGGRSNSVYAWHHDGRPVDGWPVGGLHAISSQITVGDIDGDGLPELVWSSNTQWADGTGRLIAYNHDGTPVAGWPINTRGSGFNNPVLLGDLDADGDTEMFVATGDLIEFRTTYYALNLRNGGAATDIQLGMHQFNPGREGVHPSATRRLVGAESNETLSESPAIDVHPSSTNVVISVAGVGTGRLAVFAPDGALVKAWDLHSLPARVRWDRRTRRGGTAAPGVYFVTLRTDDARSQRKFVLLD